MGTKSNVALFNAIRATLSETFQQRVPMATQATFPQLVTVFMSDDFEVERNQWLNALINKVGLTIIQSKMLQNKLARFKRGTFNLGDTVEEIFVDAIKAESFHGTVLGDEPDQFKRRNPNVKACYHRLNRKDFYATTLDDDRVRLAFTSEGGIQRLYDAIAQQLYSSNNVDEYLMQKELFSQYINAPKYPLRPDQKVFTPAVVDEASGKDFLRAIRQGALDMGFNARNFNPIGVLTQSDPTDLVLFISKDIVPSIDVDTLSGVFNTAKADIQTPTVVVDDFGTNTDGIQAILADRDWFMVFDYMMKLTQSYNAEGLYRNMFLHVWQLFSLSYFKNAIVYAVDGTVFPPVPTP